MESQNSGEPGPCVWALTLSVWELSPSVCGPSLCVQTALTQQFCTCDLPEYGFACCPVVSPIVILKATESSFLPLVSG